MSIDAPDRVEVIEAGALELMTRGEIDSQIRTAKQYPRSIKRFKETALEMATLDEDTAAACMYAVPRGGKSIEGPSARFAEIVAQAWGNIRVGSRVIGEDSNFVTCQSMCHDLESNVAIGVEVKRRITDRNGKRYQDDMIGVTANAGLSIALRNSVLKVVPKAFWKSIYEDARRTAIGDVKTLGNKRADMVGAFQKMGVKPEQICAVVSCESVEDIGLDELATLRGLYQSLKEGETTIEQAFPKSVAGVAQKPDETRAQAAARALKASRTKGKDESAATDGDSRAEPVGESGAPPSGAGPAQTAPPAGHSLGEGDERDLLLAQIRKMATVSPPDQMKAVAKQCGHPSIAGLMKSLGAASLDSLRDIYGLMKL